MPTVSARLGVIALAFVTLFPTSQAAQAFGLNFGPFHVYVPIPGGHRHVARTEPAATETPQSALTPAGPPSLLYPVLAWPSIYDEIFTPSASSSWSFGYQNIFDQAFAKYPPQRSADLCPYRDRTAEIVGRITQDNVAGRQATAAAAEVGDCARSGQRLPDQILSDRNPGAAGRAPAADGQPARRHDHGAGDRAAAVASFRAILER